MKKSKRLFIVLLALMMCISAVIGYPSKVEAAAKNGYYLLIGDSIKCKISGNNLIIKKKDLYYAYSKKKFKTYESMQDVKKDYKFKLNKKIYMFVEDQPSHTVKKFGVKLDVNSGKSISKAQFKKEIKNLPVTSCCKVIVKNGKIVAFGYEPSYHTIDVD